MKSKRGRVNTKRLLNENCTGELKVESCGLDSGLTMKLKRGRVNFKRLLNENCIGEHKVKSCDSNYGMNCHAPVGYLIFTYHIS